MEVESYFPKLQDIERAWVGIKNEVIRTPTQFSAFLSNKFGANIYLKREDLQKTRSYKIRGAFNKISSLSEAEKKAGVVCASAGNHAQGLAYSCAKLGIKGTIFMPTTTPKQKVKQVARFGADSVEIILTGDTYDDSYNHAITFCNENKKVFVHPFDDNKVIEGQGTVGLEIIQDVNFKIDYLLVPVGGGGLASGISSLFSYLSPDTKIIAIEPLGAPSMEAAIEAGKVVALDDIVSFVDGAAVKKVGEKTFNICRELISEVLTIPEGKVCSTILELYNEEAMVVEPAGALSVSGLDTIKEKISGKNVVCVVSGSNNDITRFEEIKERSMLYEGLMHYFIIRFPQRAGALREFVVDVLGATDDIVHFEYTKKTSREKGPALIGIELKEQIHLSPLIDRMKKGKFFGKYLNEEPDLFRYLIGP